MSPEASTKRLGFVVRGAAAVVFAAWGWSTALPTAMAARLFGF